MVLIYLVDVCIDDTLLSYEPYALGMKAIKILKLRHDESWLCF